MSVKFKWALNNEGNPCVTDGQVYVGFLTLTQKELDMMNRNGIKMYQPYSQQGVKDVGLDKITDWKEEV